VRKPSFFNDLIFYVARTHNTLGRFQYEAAGTTVCFRVLK